MLSCLYQYNYNKQINDYKKLGNGCLSNIHNIIAISKLELEQQHKNICFKEINVLLTRIETTLSRYLKKSL